MAELGSHLGAFREKQRQRLRDSEILSPAVLRRAAELRLQRVREEAGL